ncbi:hypothetical protein [Sphingobium sp.]|uniref:hypothetical protein n=1 Tax=Sphingobium sp. TaxID=1912891 RepID=UPI0028BE19C7|nr:hypothetical protein [Sphingobium sp.]
MRKVLWLNLKADLRDVGARIREVEQVPDDARWLLEDDEDGSHGQLLKLMPAQFQRASHDRPFKFH